MFGELVRRIFKSSPNVAVGGAGINVAQMESVITKQTVSSSSCVVDAKLKPIYWLLGTLSVCTIVVDLLLLMYVNRIMLTNIAQPTMRWALDEYGREEMRQVALKVVREEVALMRQLAGYFGDEKQQLEQHHYYDDDRGKLQYNDGYLVDR